MGDPVSLLDAEIRSYLDACTDQVRIRVTLPDAPTMPGWAAWREIAESP